MTEFSIFRPLSNEEKFDIIPLPTKDVMNNFLAELAKVSAEYQKKLKPYDSYSAIIDFEERIKNKLEEYNNAVDKTTVEQFSFGNLESYGNLDRFEFLESVDQLSVRLVAGIKQEVVTGKRYRFRCKQRGNKISLVVDSGKVDEYEKWLFSVFKNPQDETVEESKKEVKKDNSKLNKKE